MARLRVFRIRRRQDGDLVPSSDNHGLSQGIYIPCIPVYMRQSYCTCCASSPTPWATPQHGGVCGMCGHSKKSVSGVRMFPSRPPTPHFLSIHALTLSTSCCTLLSRRWWGCGWFDDRRSWRRDATRRGKPTTAVDCCRSIVAVGRKWNDRKRGTRTSNGSFT